MASWPTWAPPKDLNPTCGSTRPSLQLLEPHFLVGGGKRLLTPPPQSVCPMELQESAGMGKEGKKAEAAPSHSLQGGFGRSKWTHPENLLGNISILRIVLLEMSQ